MRTVHPAIMIGNYVWDEDRLPRDEFAPRLAELHRLMDARGWRGMLIHGDARAHAALAYYTNFVPRLRWALALVPRHGEPRLLISMSSRDMPAMKLMTWIADVRSGWDWSGGFDSWLASLGRDDAAEALGTLGLDQISGTLNFAVERSAGNRVQLHDASPLLPEERPLRPREVSLMRDACAVVSRADAAVRAAWQDGKGAEAALLAGERAARLLAAQDVRTLVSLDGGRTLLPFQGKFAARTDPLVAYIAVKASGFWAESFITVTARPSDVLRRAQAGLAAALVAAGPDVVSRALYAQVVAPLGRLPLHPALSAAVGRRVGLSLDEGGALTADSAQVMAAGSVYALHVGAIDAAAGGALVSAMVAITPRGAEVLLPMQG